MLFDNPYVHDNLDITAISFRQSRSIGQLLPAIPAQCSVLSAHKDPQLVDLHCQQGDAQIFRHVNPSPSTTHLAPPCFSQRVFIMPVDDQQFLDVVVSPSSLEYSYIYVFPRL